MSTITRLHGKIRRPFRVIQPVLLCGLVAAMAAVAAGGRARADQPAPAPLGNISTRGFVGTGDRVLIGGIMVRGEPVSVIVRGIGPSMAGQGVPGTLQNPRLQLFYGDQPIAENDDWQQGSCASGVPEGLRPKDPLEACLAITLPLSGPYTAIVSGTGGSTGVGLVELFHVGGVGEFANLATRGVVGKADDALIGGFIIRDHATKVVLRGKGPSLGFTGLPDLLRDPELQVFSGQVLIAENSGWPSGNCEAEAGEPYHFLHGPEPCLVLTLEPGPYTAIIRGAGGATGVGMVEVFKLED